MASNLPGVRWVRCPKCHKVLSEIAAIPVYKCGGCGTVLRAKNHGVTGERATSSGSLETVSQNLSEGKTSSGSLETISQNLSESSSSNKEPVTVVNQSIPTSSNGGVPDSSNANTDQIEECSDHVEKGNEVRGSGNVTPSHQSAPERSEEDLEEEIEPEERETAKYRQSPDKKSQKSASPVPGEQKEKFLVSNPQDYDKSRSSKKVEEPPEFIGSMTASADQDVKLTAGRSYSYDGSASSSDNSRENNLSNNYLVLSRRTFRQKKVLNSADCLEEDEKFRSQKSPEKAPVDRESSSIPQLLRLNGVELPSRNHIRSVARDTTFGSKDFHSVQNWIGSETDDGASRSLFKDPFLRMQKVKPSAKLQYREPDHIKILRKVDKLRDELSVFINRTMEGEGTGQFENQPAHVPFSSPPRPHNKNIHQTGDGWEKLRCKEKKAVIKSHCRPVSAGAPFVICYKCWKLLQLPADFLVTQKRLHKLRCGACSGVLVFSFRPRDHTAPVTPAEGRHPPSEAENNTGRMAGGPFSYSDDDGMAFARNNSSEAEKVLHVSRNSSYSIEGSNGQNVRAGQLHRLMGYSSASELLFQTRDVGGYQSTEPDTPQFYRPVREYTTYGPPNPGEIQEEDELQEKLRTRQWGSALPGFLKKGVKELNHGLESLKLKIHSNG